MKRLVIVLMVLCCVQTIHGQTKLEKTIAVRSGQRISMDFTWPELISIRTWDRNEVKIVASVEINKGQNDDAFAFDIDENTDELSINSYIKNLKSLPRKIIIYRGDEEHFFNTDDMNSPEVRKFKDQYGSESFSMSHGVIKDILVEVWLPKNATLDVYAKFGLIEVFGYAGNMKIHSKFGGVDVSTDGKKAISAGTKFGEKYTDLTSNIKTLQLGSSPGKWDWVMIGSQSDASQELKSEFGNIYIRRL